MAKTKKKQASKKKAAEPSQADLMKALGPEARAKHQQLSYQPSHDEQPMWHLLVVHDSGSPESLQYTSLENMQKQLIKLAKSSIESYHVYMFFGVQAFLSEATESGLRYLITPDKNHPLPLFEDRVELDIDLHGTLGLKDVDIEKPLDDDDEEEEEEEYDYEEDEAEVVVGDELDSAEAADRDEQLRKFTPPGEDIPEESDDEDEELADDEEWEYEEEEEEEETES